MNHLKQKDNFMLNLEKSSNKDKIRSYMILKSNKNFKILLKMEDIKKKFLK